MLIPVFASTKGGVGKSTLAVCTAVAAVEAGHSVYLLDLDPQKSTEKWWRRRNGPDNPMLITGVDTVSTAVRAVRAKKAERDYLIVDSPNSFMGVLSDAIEAADCVAIVTTPSPKDIEGIAAAEVLVQKLKAMEKMIYVVNCSDKNKLTQEAIDILSKRSLFPPVSVREYVDYQKADKAGKTGNEVRDEAREDIARLWNRMEGIANGERADGQSALRLNGLQ